MYKYKFRQGYGSHKLLIEFFYGAESNFFISDLINVLEELHPEILEIDDLSMHDEILIHIKSKIGAFLLSKDPWGIAFLTAENNQECLLQINSILEKAVNFEKAEVNFEDYKLK